MSRFNGLPSQACWCTHIRAAWSIPSGATLIGIRAIRSRNSMDANSAEEFLKRKYTLWIVSFLTIVLFLVTNLPWRLDDYDQAKQAFTSFEMVKEGHWLYQHTPHERVATKPPLVGWISAGVFATTGSGDAAWGLSSFFAAPAISLLLFLAARSAYCAIPCLFALRALGL